MYKVYVLLDENGLMYKGMTSDIGRRIKEHKNGHTKSTKHLKNIKLVYSEEFPDRISARAREIYLKSAAGRRFLKRKLKTRSGSSVG